MIFGVYIIVVEVPIEGCLALVFQSSEELLFHHLHHVETNENIVLIFEVYHGLFSHIAIEHSLVSQACLA